jgi:hypothetical protein
LRIAQKHIGEGKGERDDNCGAGRTPQGTEAGIVRRFDSYAEPAIQGKGVTHSELWRRLSIASILAPAAR